MQEYPFVFFWGVTIFFLLWEFEYLLSLSLMQAGSCSQDAHCVFREEAMGKASSQCLVIGSKDLQEGASGYT